VASTWRFKGELKRINQRQGSLDGKGTEGDDHDDTDGFEEPEYRVTMVNSKHVRVGIDPDPGWLTAARLQRQVSKGIRPPWPRSLGVQDEGEF
jgi:hypothetical protein